MFRFICAYVIVLHVMHTEAFPQSALLLRRRRQRDVPCTANLYQHGNICCPNCPAGSHVKSHCTSEGGKGTCQECASGTYTEHSNGLNQCFPCTLCRPDQELVMMCSLTQDTVCQCKKGRFCAPDQACEVCKKCSRCETDERIVRNCTSTTNTECKKIKSSSASVSAKVLGSVLFAVVSVIFVIGYICWKRCKATDAQSQRPDGTKAAQSDADTSPAEERRNSQTQRPSHSNWQAEEEQFPEIVPVEGEKSLRKCFEYLEDLEVDYHKRFFRHLGINDNVIKSKESLLYEDKIHELLNIWVEKEGREASLNDLLKVLLNLSLRRTAETVREKALLNGHYICQS